MTGKMIGDLMGGLFVGVGAYQLLVQYRFSSSGERAVGRIVGRRTEIRDRNSSSGNSMQTKTILDIEFATRAGEKIRISEEGGWELIFAREQVGIVYMPNNPGLAETVSIVNWLKPLVALAVGGFLLFVSQKV